jgi:hypothetical protein
MNFKYTLNDTNDSQIVLVVNWTINAYHWKVLFLTDLYEKIKSIFQ